MSKINQLNDTFDNFTLPSQLNLLKTNNSIVKPTDDDEVNSEFKKRDISFDDSAFFKSFDISDVENAGKESVVVKEKPHIKLNSFNADDLVFDVTFEDEFPKLPTTIGDESNEEENTSGNESVTEQEQYKYDIPLINAAIEQISQALGIEPILYKRDETTGEVMQVTNDPCTTTVDNSADESDTDDCPLDNDDRAVQLSKLEYNEKDELSAWGLPSEILEKYESRKICKMFDWQIDCLSNLQVLKRHKNLLYSAPTSAGKTLVAELLSIKTIVERNKKVIFILPFVSVVREKMFYFQDILSEYGVRVDGFMGSYNPPGGFEAVQLAVCTIEKANSLINKLLLEENIKALGAVVIDEMHLIGDSSRGYLLELLLTKLRYISLKDKAAKIQIIGMSATLPNLEILSTWLDAELYITNFRPIPLDECVQVGGEIYDSNLKVIRKLDPLSGLDVDTDHILQLCLETVKDSCSVLIFCPTKKWCENLAQQISQAFWKLTCGESEFGVCLRTQLQPRQIGEVLGQLEFCPTGLDDVLRKTVSFGVAFHHAGLTMDERDIIETAFRSGVVRVLIATSTLSSGVNLPARRVIIRTPKFHGKPIDALVYRQMIGRAGRMGRDTAGESILICQKNEFPIAKELLTAELEPIESCLESSGKLKRAILEVVASGIATAPEDIELFTDCTLLKAQSKDLACPIEDSLQFLINNEFIRLQKTDDSTQYLATNLGKACLSSSLPPEEGLSLFTELEKARQCFVLESELHLIYLVTPYTACYQWGDMDWMLYLDLWEKLPSCMKKVGDLVGVREYYLVSGTRGRNSSQTAKHQEQLLIHKRFLVALVLQDLVNELPLTEVCTKYRCNRGTLQSLQLTSSTFAGMVTAFSHQLGWSSVEILISQFQDRLQFGVSRDLLDLMRLPVLNGKTARALFSAGLETLARLASSDLNAIEGVLLKNGPFESGKLRPGESTSDLKDRNKMRTIWIVGREGLTAREAAEIILDSVRTYLKDEMGLKQAEWDNDISKEPVANADNIKEQLDNNQENANKELEDNQDDINKQPDDNKANIVKPCEDNEENANKDELQDDINKQPDDNKDNIDKASEDNDENVNKPPDEEKIEATLNTNISNISSQSLFSTNNDSINNTSSQSLFERGIAEGASSSQQELINDPFHQIVRAHFDKLFLKIKALKRKSDDDDDDNNALEGQPSKKMKTTENVDEAPVNNITSFIIVDIDLEDNSSAEFVNELKQQGSIALSIGCKPKFEANSAGTEPSPSTTHREVDGFAVCWGEDMVYYVRFVNDKSRDLLKSIINEETVFRIFDSKQQIKTIRRYLGVQFASKIEDPKIADWLLEPDGIESSLAHMMYKYLKRCDDLRNLLPHTLNARCFGLDFTNSIEAKKRASIDAYSTWYITDSIKTALIDRKPQLLNVFDREMTIIKILARMEMTGIKVNRAVIENVLVTLKTQISNIEKKAYRLAGRRFAFTSLRDLNAVLKLTTSKTQLFSTKREVLEQLDNPLASLVLQWRKLNGTVTNMVMPLLRVMNNNSIRGNYITYTATGRISMHEPNLQNIAKPFDIVNPFNGDTISINCRDAFISRPGYVMLSADYCQLELRLLAHLSQDQILRAALLEGDVFKAIAAKWYRTAEILVTDEMRQQAKKICYGIIYGLSSQRFARQLSISEADGESLIESFKQTYQQMTSYLKKVVRRCRGTGYVETLGGRRRSFKNLIHNRDITLRNKAERQAVNTTIQGSAADIAKKAMIMSYENFYQYGTRLLLHIHDELVYEIPESGLRNIARRLKYDLEHVEELLVPLPVKLKTGPSWGQLTDYSP